MRTHDNGTFEVNWQFDDFIKLSLRIRNHFYLHFDDNNEQPTATFRMPLEWEPKLLLSMLHLSFAVAVAGFIPRIATKFEFAQQDLRFFFSLFLSSFSTSPDLYYFVSFIWYHRPRAFSTHATEDWSEDNNALLEHIQYTHLFAKQNDSKTMTGPHRCLWGARNEERGKTINNLIGKIANAIGWARVCQRLLFDCHRLHTSTRSSYTETPYVWRLLLRSFCMCLGCHFAIDVTQR